LPNPGVRRPRRVCVRRSLDRTSWEAANRKIQELETHGEKNVVSVKDAPKKFKADCKARNPTAATTPKNKYVGEELEETFDLSHWSSDIFTLLEKKGWRPSGW
jgi:hypothetical protein